jgi:hypothetical protein
MFSYLDAELAPILATSILGSVRWSGLAAPPRHTGGGMSMLKRTIRLRWKGKTIEIEIEIGLNL